MRLPVLVDPPESLRSDHQPMSIQTGCPGTSLESHSPFVNWTIASRFLNSALGSSPADTLLRLLLEFLHRCHLQKYYTRSSFPVKCRTVMPPGGISIAASFLASSAATLAFQGSKVRKKCGYHTNRRPANSCGTFDKPSGITGTRSAATRDRTVIQTPQEPATVRHPARWQYSV